MKANRILMLMILLVVLFVSACAPPAPGAGPSDPATPEPAGETPQAEVLDLEKLIEELRAAGHTVELGEVQSESFFSVPGQVIKVNNLSVTVWEYADEDRREADTATIQGAGFIIGTAAVDWMDEPHFWAKDRVIVLYVGKDPALVEQLTMLLGNKLFESGNSGMVDKENAPFVLAAKDELAEKLAIPVEDIVFISADLVEWPDACLGLAAADEMCAQVVTPGYQVKLEARGEQYEVHTDESGAGVRIK